MADQLPVVVNGKTYSGLVLANPGSGGGGGGTSGGTSTAADPSYTEGTSSAPLSMDLAGYLRTGAKQVGAWNIGNITGTISLPTGAATQTTLAGVLTACQAATPAGEAHIGAFGGNTVVAGGTITRPANTTAYASGQLVANNTTAGSVTPVACAVGRINAGTGSLNRVRLSTNHASLAGTEVFRVHLYNTSPTSTVGDAGTFSAGTNGLAAGYLGYCDVTLDRVFSDGSKGFGIPALSNQIAFACAGGSQNIYALLEARGAYTPTSGEVFTIALEVFQD